MSLRETCAAYTEHLLGKENVVGVGVGDNDVVVLVSKKKPLADLLEEDIIEPQLDDPIDGDRYPTDVVEVGKVIAMSTWLRPGASIGMAGYRHTGTYGMTVVKSKKLSILSNNHVIGVEGATVVHPGPSDGAGSPVGVVSEVYPINYSQDASNVIDAAVAELDDPVGSNNDILSTPVVVGVGDLVSKTGRTSGYTEGVVTARDVTVVVDFGIDGLARFVGQVMTTSMIEPGDSGSIGVTEDGYPFGLGFAGSSMASFYNPIHEVLSRLDLRLPLDLPDAPPPPPSRPRGCWLIELLKRLWS